MASEELCVNTIRILSADVVQKANSGHPGAPMGCAPIAHALWAKVMNYSPSNPDWINRDRFVLSNGHACALLYTMLHLTGYEDITMDELKQFRQFGAKTAGHPENHLVRGVEVSTGPLGQGISNAVGFAIAEEHLRATYNGLIDHFTYVLCGDGCLQEGISSEACSLAGHLGLGRLIVLYDDNHVTIDGDTALSFTEDVLQRYEGYGWHTLTVTNGDSTDTSAIEEAISQAKAVTDRPSIIKVRTTIGIGSKLAGTGKVHGSPLGEDDLANVKTKFGFDPNQKFVVDDQVRAYYLEAAARGHAKFVEWNQRLAEFGAAHPDQAKEFSRRLSGQLPEGWQSKLPRFAPSDPKKATRQWSQSVLQALTEVVPELVGGSADLTPSNGTELKNYPAFQKNSRHGRYFHFGVREHGMAAICNGIAAYGMNFVPFGATFLNFIEYALGAVRVCALSYFRVIWVMTHDSIGLGEDGPTHQPVEVNALLRALPNILFIRPGDGNETSGAYLVALENTKRSSVLALSRQAMPNLAGTSVEKVALGGYVVSEAADPDVILVGTGSELHLCFAAAALLPSLSIRIVSMPCTQLFDEQPRDYQLSVFTPTIPVVSIEALSAFGWSRYSHSHVGVSEFGVSAPGEIAMEKFGITAKNLAERVNKVITVYPKGTAPDLNALRWL
eukprot:c8416_g1_i2.p1 GENE.c8416_g1_i2~~c8416_g1_i2.p1  ORF type:complete len:670 (+),score=179.46 c8416_g1_i2:43-2052(+)